MESAFESALGKLTDIQRHAVETAILPGYPVLYQRVSWKAFRNALPCATACTPVPV
jgi:hypothetical protein